MYHTFFFISRLSKNLNSFLSGAKLIECFSQEKDEIVFYFELPDGNLFYIKANMGSGIGHLSFPSEFNRSRSNSADLFPSVSGQIIIGLKQSKNDRSFHLIFSNGEQICFKMYGGRSNILLHDGLTVKDVFNHHLKKDIGNPPPSDLIPDEKLYQYSSDPEILRENCPTFNNRIWACWNQIASTLDSFQAKSAFSEFCHQLKLGPIFLCRDSKEVFVSFFPIGEILNSSHDSIEISNLYSKYYWTVNQFLKKKETTIYLHQQKLFDAKNQIQMTEKQLIGSESDLGYRAMADLLMAFGHLVPKGALEARLPNFSNDGMVDIKLKKELSPQGNAERYYKKAKGQNQDLERIRFRLEQWKEAAEALNEKLEKLITAKTFHELTPFLNQTKEKGEDLTSKPYHKHECLKYKSWVGKNAKANEELLKLAHKDDLWLHARDVGGSHVIIRQKKGITTPKPVVERAAELAAYYSKGKNNPVCGVMMTERKYVRKIKNTPAGMVRVEKETTILVSPKP